MSSAIEVLREMLKAYETTGENLDWQEAMREALLALEEKEEERKLKGGRVYVSLPAKMLDSYQRDSNKLDKLKEWLDKEKEIVLQTQEEQGNKVFHEELRLKFLEEVMGLL